MAPVRWHNVGDFLSDLPRFHCSVKPDHTFCTVCLRINPSVAMDCPLREEDLGRAPGRAAEPPRAQGDFYPEAPEEVAAAEYEAMEAERVPAAAVLPDAPVIEFARSTEPHQPRKRMKARVVQKRVSTGRDGEGGAEPPRRMEPDERVWATHDPGAGPEEGDLRDLDTEQQGPAGHRPPRPPRPPTSG